jgi:DNA-binding response OmpR family regulator
MAPLRILVVDDEPNLGELLEEYLTTHGYRVTLAAHGLAALAILERQPVDVIISDVLMDTLDGPGFYQELERHHPALLRRFIWISGETSREARAEAFIIATGAPLIRKPFHLPDVLAAVTAITAR